MVGVVGLVNISVVFFQNCWFLIFFFELLYITLFNQFANLQFRHLLKQSNLSWFFSKWAYYRIQNRIILFTIVYGCFFWIYKLPTTSITYAYFFLILCFCIFITFIYTLLNSYSFLFHRYFSLILFGNIIILTNLINCTNLLLFFYFIELASCLYLFFF